MEPAFGLAEGACLSLLILLALPQEVKCTALSQGRSIALASSLLFACASALEQAALAAAGPLASASCLLPLLPTPLGPLRWVLGRFQGWIAEVKPAEQLEKAPWWRQLLSTRAASKLERALVKAFHCSSGAKASRALAPSSEPHNPG